jgi:hypothetical protein
VFQGYLATGLGHVVTSLESADSAKFDYLSSRNVWGRDEWIFLAIPEGTMGETQVVLTNSSLRLKLSYYTIYILTEQLIMSHVLES